MTKDQAKQSFDDGAVYGPAMSMKFYQTAQIYILDNFMIFFNSCHF
jgi:hypothetical protein